MDWTIVALLWTRVLFLSVETGDHDFRKKSRQDDPGSMWISKDTPQQKSAQESTTAVTHMQDPRHND